MRTSALLICTVAAFAQTLPQFDAASVRINQSSDRASTHYDAARVDLHKASMRHLFRRAFPLPDYQVVLPAWVDAQRFAVGYDVSVTFPKETTPDNLQLMFQDLLETRFALKSHWETRDTKLIEIHATGTGPKLKPAANPAPPTDFPKYTTRVDKGEWHFSTQLAGAPSGLSIAGLLDALNATHLLGRPLVDATAIEGIYDLEFSAPADPPDNRPAESEILSSLEKQLGLKATSKTVPLKILIVDRLEKTPTEN